MTKNQLSEGADGFWFGYLTYVHPDECPPQDAWPWARTLSNNAFRAGARWAVKQTSELSPYVAKFIEMMILLGYLDDDAPLMRVNAQPLTTDDIDGTNGLLSTHLEGFTDVPF